MGLLTKPLRLYIAGHQGMVGRALHRLFVADQRYQLVTATRQQLDLTDQASVRQFMAQQKPDLLIVAAARVGGIAANAAQPVEFLLQNLQIQTNLLEAAFQTRCQRVLFLGSSCIYPRDCQQPISETALLTGPLEATNDAYALAKITGLRLCSAYRQQYGADFRALMPTNLYGPFDNFAIGQAHVIPALLHRFHLAAQTGAPLQIWGSGKPLREFLHVDDLALACKFVLELAPIDYQQAVAQTPGFLNVGSGAEISIAGLAQQLAELTGYQGELQFDASKPDGTPRKLLDCSRLQALGWQASIDLAAGLQQTYRWYLAQSNLRL